MTQGRQPPSNPEANSEASPEAAPKAKRKTVPERVIRLLTLQLILFMMLDLMAISGVIMVLIRHGHGFHAIALMAGHVIGVAIGLSWVAGTLISANRAPKDRIGLTLMFSPLRYVGALLSMFLIGSWLNHRVYVITLVLACIGTHVLFQVILGFMGVRMARAAT